MKKFHFVRSLVVHGNRQAVFEFFSQLENLARLTPPRFALQVLTSPTLKLHQGLRIDYERGQISIHGRPSGLDVSGTQLFGARVRPTFSRSFSIPGTIDVSRIEATLKQGVLKVKLPKMEQAKPRQIPVKVS